MERDAAHLTGAATQITPGPAPGPHTVEGVLELPVTSPDGTRLRAWRTGAGPHVVLSNGLGAPADAWPGLVTPDSGFDVLSWDHRGLGGSSRPADPARIRVEDHAEDLVAVMDAAGVERALLVGWSLGVGVAFEVALALPERVAGVLAVAGVRTAVGVHIAARPQVREVVGRGPVGSAAVVLSAEGCPPSLRSGRSAPLAEPEVP